MEVTPVDGPGTLYASTVVEHQVDPEWPVPYTIVLVDVDRVPGLRLAGSLPGRWHLRAGQPMDLWFEHRPDGRVVPQWKPLAWKTESASSG
ncbi:MAG: OB-fold domain-containing protein [Acidimicrobiia bacterium]